MRWLVVLALVGCGGSRPTEEPTELAPPPPGFDPAGWARASSGTVVNAEAAVPPSCYARTDRGANPCWTCHTGGFGPNTLDDGDLQARYGFSEVAHDNHWTNLFVDRRAAIAAIPDAEILAWIREDDYASLRAALADQPGYRGWRPDLELAAGFDADGFAVDGTGWRAVRYQPFPGPFWPSAGSTGDVFVRLPGAFQRDAHGAPSRETYRLNLAILEAAIAGVTDPDTRALDREVEPVDERLVGEDLDGDGAIRDGTTRIRRLPARYAGGARGLAVEALIYPLGVELMHSVRYLDPDAPGLLARRMKELRYLRKVEAPDASARLRAYAHEVDEKEEGLTPRYRGDALEGLVNAFGWKLQAFIEDEQGRLRLQTDEEHRSCMGCHQGVGVTIDSTFSFARKVPGRDGWRPQDLRGLLDRPQVGQLEGELATYFERLGQEPPRGDDLFAALAPDRDRALALDKAYLLVVREQSFTRGRDAVLAPATDVHHRIDVEDTGLAAAGRAYHDGRLQLAWP